MIKQLFIDVETTGRVSATNSIWSLSLIVVIDGEVKERKSFLMKPTTEFEEVALEMAIYPLDEILAFPNQEIAFAEFTKTLEKYVDKYDKTDKFFFTGYNSKFDEEFVREWFTKNDDGYYGSWFFAGTMDVMTMCVYALQAHRAKMPNFKLETLAKLFDVEIDVHKSESDVEATYEIYKELSQNIIPIIE